MSVLTLALKASCCFFFLTVPGPNFAHPGAADDIAGRTITKCLGLVSVLCRMLLTPCDTSSSSFSLSLPPSPSLSPFPDVCSCLLYSRSVSCSVLISCSCLFVSLSKSLMQMWTILQWRCCALTRWGIPCTALPGFAALACCSCSALALSAFAVACEASSAIYP